jgi:hypothetical protein
LLVLVAVFLQLQAEVIFAAQQFWVQMVVLLLSNLLVVLVVHR